MKAVVSKVALGEADVGIVYVTDVQASGDVDGVTIPADVNITAEYPIVELAESTDPAAARAFIEFVRSPAGLEILQQFGFGRP